VSGPGPGGIDVDALADDVARTRARWHAARQAIDDARHAYEKAIRDEVAANRAHHAALAAYDANKGWR